MTVASNQFQNHNQLLRHGMLNWVTRGVFLGYERNYLELDVDDVFLPDDKWDAAANVTDYRPEAAIRMTAADVANAVAWQRQTGLRMNLVYNMGGIAEFGAGDLLAALRGEQATSSAGSTTRSSTRTSTARTTRVHRRTSSRRTRPQFDAQFKPGLAAGSTIRPSSSPASTRGSPTPARAIPGRSIRRSFSDAEPAATGGTLAAGTYEYGVTASTAAGETPASVTQVTVAGATSSVAAELAVGVLGGRLQAVPPAGRRRLVAAGGLGHDPRSAGPRPPSRTRAPTDVTYRRHRRDGGHRGRRRPRPTARRSRRTARTRPSSPALTAAGIRTVASDASKGYPNPPAKDPVSEADPTNFPKGATFAVGPAQAVPRYPSNIYYNVANRADQLDEYNWIYTSPPVGAACRSRRHDLQRGRGDLAAVPRPRDADHVRPPRGERPRPHYFHQTNIAQSDLTKADTDTRSAARSTPSSTRCSSATTPASTARRRRSCSSPTTQIAQTLVQQGAWSAARANVSAWVQDGRVYVRNAGAAAVAVPLTGTTAGGDYARPALRLDHGRPGRRRRRTRR